MRVLFVLLITLSACSKITDEVDLVHEKGHADWFLDSDACRKHNLTNHLHVPELKIESKVHFDFK